MSEYVQVCASMCVHVSTYICVNVCLKGMTLSYYKWMCTTDIHYTFITAGPSDCSDNDAAHHTSVAAMSLNATGKCNIIYSSFLLQHAISTQSNVHNLTCCIYIGIQKLSSVLKAVKRPKYHYAEVKIGSHNLPKSHSKFTTEPRVYEECGGGVISSNVAIGENPAYQSVDLAAAKP